MTTEPSIRLVQKKDLKSLVALCKLHAIYEKSDYSSEGKEVLLDKHLFSENPSLHCLVAEKDDRLVGYATFMPQFSTWDATHYIYVDCLFLTEDSRGFGIGEKLIDQIKEEGKKLNCSLIQWQTPEFNKRAMKFYDRIGAIGKSKKRYFLGINA